MVRPPTRTTTSTGGASPRGSTSFTLYEPADAQRGRPGTTEALLALAVRSVPGYNVADVYAAASLMKLDGDVQAARPPSARPTVTSHRNRHEIYRDRATDKGLDPFG